MRGNSLKPGWYHSRERDGRSRGEIRRGWQEAAMGVSDQGEKSISPKTQKNILTTHFGRYSITLI